MTEIVSHEVWCKNAPVEIAGTLSDGRHFYFRARWDTASLTFSDVSRTDALDANIEDGPAAIRAVGEPDGYAASWLTYDEAMQLIAEML